MAQEGGAPQGGGFEGMLPMLIMMMLVMGVFIFFSRRSQKRQQTEHQKMIESLKGGTKVMLNSGLIGLVDKVDKDNQEVRLLIDEDKRVHARFNWGAVTKVFSEEVNNVAAKDKA
jgi:preprotein translocase YajC subunit